MATLGKEKRSVYHFDLHKRSNDADIHPKPGLYGFLEVRWMQQIVFIRLFAAVWWNQALPLIRETASSRDVTLLSFIGEEAWHMETKLEYLVQMCMGVKMCYSLSVGVCQSNKQNRSTPSALLMRERGSSRCFDSNLWNYGLCVVACACVCVRECMCMRVLGEIVPSVFLV